MLEGGLIAHRPYLIVGPSGTGKTTLALQFLCEGVRRGERCLLVTLEEPPNEMRVNHRSLAPEIDRVYIFDAIPDVMRYERAPFKDIAAVRESIEIGKVPYAIRRTPELSSVEVTFTALEQTLRMESVRRQYSRIVIDSLTALQYFCMKGFDETQGAQTFLRFLSDMRVTTILTVEAPLEDAETPERLLARGEIRLFRWEVDGLTVRAIGVEKFRGSEHDIRLHPYRISPKGLDINLDVTISRDARLLLPERLTAGTAPPAPVPEPVPEFSTSLAAFEQDLVDLVSLGQDIGPVRSDLLDALAAAGTSPPEEVARVVARARGRALEIAERLGAPDQGAVDTPASRRLRSRAAGARTGVPPSGAPDPTRLRPQLEEILRHLQTLAPAAASLTGERVAVRATPPTPAAAPPATAPPVPPSPSTARPLSPAPPAAPLTPPPTTPVSPPTVPLTVPVLSSVPRPGPSPVPPSAPGSGPPPLPTAAPAKPVPEPSPLPSPAPASAAAPLPAPLPAAIEPRPVPAVAVPPPRGIEPAGISPAPMPIGGTPPLPSTPAVPPLPTSVGPSEIPASLPNEPAPSATKRRRKASAEVGAAPRKRAVRPAAAAPPGVPGEVPAPGTVAPSPGSDLSPAGGPTPVDPAAAPAKPKRRSPRKKAVPAAAPTVDGPAVPPPPAPATAEPSTEPNAPPPPASGA